MKSFWDLQSYGITPVNANDFRRARAGGMPRVKGPSIFGLQRTHDKSAAAEYVALFYSWIGALALKVGALE